MAKVANKTRGGSKPGERRGGRQKGVPNKANKARIEAATKSGLLPHEFMLAVSRGETFDGYKPDFKDRLYAANAAAPYYAPKLATVAHTGKNGGPISMIDLTKLSDEQLEALHPVVEMLAGIEDANGA